MHTQAALGCLPRELCWVGAQRGEVECARVGRSLSRTLRWFHDRSEMHVVIPVQFSAQSLSETDAAVCVIGPEFIRDRFKLNQNKRPQGLAWV